MPFVIPFSGVRFNQEKITDLSKVICPPYDVISSQDRKHIFNSHPNNVIRLELPESRGNSDKYEEASKTLNKMFNEKILKQDTSRHYYLYEQGFKLEKRYCRRLGFFAAVRVEDPRKGSILPHERTFAGPKEDRLKLMRALRMNVSPIFLVFADKRKRIIKLLKTQSRKKPVFKFRDIAGISHTLWLIDDKNTQSSMHNALSDKKLFIADGHHRYETAWKYSQLNSEDIKRGVYNNSNFILSFICPMEDKGLVILPTHRLIELSDANAFFKLNENISKYFTKINIEKFSDFKRLLNASSSRSENAFGLINSKENIFIKLNIKLEKANILNSHSKAYRALDVTILHNLILKDVNIKGIRYIKDSSEILRVVKKEKNTCGFLLKSTSVQEVEQVAKSGEAMPEKSTYFYPKLATGIVLKSLVGGV
ncbi:MAG: DUF1015 domain-containing protein [bacterium]